MGPCHPLPFSVSRKLNCWALIICQCQITSLIQMHLSALSQHAPCIVLKSKINLKEGLRQRTCSHSKARKVGYGGILHCPSRLRPQATHSNTTPILKKQRMILACDSHYNNWFGVPCFPQFSIQSKLLWGCSIVWKVRNRVLLKWTEHGTPIVIDP